MEPISGVIAEPPATAAKLPLTVVIPTLNESARLAELLTSLRWVEEVIVADGGSSDATVAVARAHGATVIERAGDTIAAQRNDAIECASNEWVFALDADERISDTLREELAEVLKAPVHAAYRVRRQNFFLGRERRRGRWGRDCLAYGSWLDGSFGFLTSVLTAYACFLKYAYLWELGRRPLTPPPS